MVSISVLKYASNSDKETVFKNLLHDNIQPLLFKETQGETTENV